MNLTFLGDALDHWKGSLFESLQGSGITTRLAVEPMATDLRDWHEADFALLARLLKVGRDQILRHSVPLLERRQYFKEIQHDGDLFVDPDTGVATGPVKQREKYVMPDEVAALLQPAGRLLMVYQHIRAQRVSARVDAVIQALRPHAPRASWCTYESGTVAMLFLARDGDRVAAVVQHFGNLLGRHVKGRIRSGAIGP